MKGAAVAAVCLLGGLGQPTWADCRVEIETSTGKPAVYQLEVARTPEARGRGLMGRTALPAQGGMLFDFGEEVPAVFWMHETPLALDILYVSASLRVVDVLANTTPNSDRLLPASMPVRYAVELAAGEAARAGVKPGARLTLPPAYPAACP